MNDILPFLVAPAIAFFLPFIFRGLVNWAGSAPRELAIIRDLEYVSQRVTFRAVIERLFGEARPNPDSLLIATAALSRTEWRQLANIYAEQAASTGSAEAVIEVLQTIEASPTLRQVMRPFTQELSLVAEARLQQPLTQLRRDVDEIRTRSPARQARLRRIVIRVLDVSISFLILVLLAVAFLVTLTWVWFLYRLWRDGSFPVRRHRQLGLYARPLTTFEIRSGLLVERSYAKWLNAFGIHQIPTYWNVLRGRMSLVGPRPVCYYWPLHMRGKMLNRFLVKPGVTGYTQMRAMRQRLTLREMAELESSYSVGLTLEKYCWLLAVSFLDIFARPEVPVDRLLELRDAVAGQAGESSPGSSNIALA
jgi:lipopolysaccharide/colanic/teichoic acid biosynthesis glycosyltransferase